MNNDLISREALKEAINSSIAQATKVGIMADADYLWELLNYAIDNAPTVEAFTKEDMAGAYNEGYMCGNKEAEKSRMQGEWICPNCDLYEQAENNYCQYAGRCTIVCRKCKYFKRKGGAE